MTNSLSEIDGCLPKVVGTWRTLVSALTHGHRIYPTDPLAPKDCEFIVIDSRIQIRVIHVIPGNTRKSQLATQLCNFDINALSKRSSLSEEYWFMKWNKHLKIGSCNCSFRRSLRYSVISNQPLSKNAAQKRESLSYETAPTKIKNVDTFVERLIQETISEAFHEYYMLQNKKTGTINFGYESSENDDVVLRKKIKSDCVVQSSTNSEVNKLNGPIIENVNTNCLHKNAQKKPLVILFHGIGSSADIWSLVINALACKGYEVVAPDMLGHGFSSAPTKAHFYSFNNLLLHALTIFDYYTTDKRKCILIGHSYGSLFYSLRGKHFHVCDADSGLPRHVLESIANGQKWAEGDAAFHRRILVPTLLIHGLQDKNVTLVQECEMERTIPRAFLELIPNAGHMSMIETPEHLIHMITCFLEVWS